MSEEKEINLKDFFINHYDNSGRLYCVEHKGDPLELQNAIKRLQEENEELKKRCEELDKMTGIFSVRLADKYKQALEEIKEISKQCMTKDLCSIDCDYADHCYIEDEEVPTYDICKLIIEKINEVLNDRD